MPFAHPELKVQFDALSNDATVWNAAGETLTAAHRSLQGIEVNRGAFSFAAMDVADTYLEVHTTVMRLLDQGTEAVGGIATQLRAVRADFENNEDVTRAALYALWQPNDH
ncbi:hypothetical protein GCM10027515_28790 [Schumannella luteola]|uniref:Uncharacterized protein involved in exopolysaccharide biosynthesis n=1 Tax=Schumannella luteola TaxID=472059 RepID=A0A852YBV5_9MICO|nr:hypothetical protein [Schumannella luteola]NYG99322.1 uncharacterized protein involved in exopolysaccharide biosynthesis [Schumannella luteola]TPX06055.1 hypothetical protein FJ656_02660 [Schumannella luteola]